VQDCLGVVDALLRFNVSNQNYFRELSLPASLPPLLGFPNPPPAHDQPVPQEFSLQFWDAQRLTNANAIVGIMKMIAGGKGANTQVRKHYIAPQDPINIKQIQTALHRCLIELSLSGNAPTALKTKVSDMI
jgi:intracellular protein transport protein USO1